MAIPRGFFSGFASDIIERNEDALLAASGADAGKSRDTRDRLGWDSETGVALASTSPCFVVVSSQAVRLVEKVLSNATRLVRGHDAVARS